jgi:phospholipid/cholesterol/gamma-HCH transport system substrate-binding protein
MGRLSTAAKVGAFTVVMVVASVLIYRFITDSGVQGRGYTVWCLMNDAAGIAKMSQVKMAGIPIGQIKSVRLQEGKARIDVLVDDSVPLYDDATATKQASSLLGEFYLTLTPGTEGKRQLKDGDRIRIVIEAASTDKIMKDLSAIADDVKKVSAALARTVGTPTGETNVKETLQNLKEITDNLNQAVRENKETVRHIMVNVENITGKGGPQIERVLENIRVTTEHVRDLMAKPEAEGGREPGEVRQIIEKLNRSASTLETTMRHLDVVAGRLDRGEGTLGRLSKDEKLINQVEGVAEDVGEYVGGLSRLQTILGLRTDYQFLSSTVKSYVELRLQPREDKYISFEIVNDPRGLTRFEQISVSSDNPNDPPH